MIALVSAAVVAAILLWVGGDPRGRSGVLIAGGGPSDPAEGNPVSAVSPELRGWRTVWRTGWLWRGRRKSSAAADDDVLTLLSVLAPALRAGLTPADALQSSAGTLEAGSMVRRVAEAGAEAARSGFSAGRVLWVGSRESSLPELAVLARAWDLSDDTGAPLAQAAATAAEMVRSRRTSGRLVATTAAQARATITLLTALPLSGPLLSLAVGVGPSQVYTSSPLTWWSIGLGICLVVFGRVWVRALIRRVLTGPVLS